MGRVLSFVQEEAAGREGVYETVLLSQSQEGSCLKCYNAWKGGEKVEECWKFALVNS